MALRYNVFPFGRCGHLITGTVFSPFGRKGTATYTSMVEILLGVVDLSTH